MEILSKRRGSAILYVMLMLIVMTGITVAYGSLAVASRTTETRREQAVTARLAFDGATLKAAYDAGLGNISYPSTQNEAVGPVICAVTISGGGSTIGHTLSLTSTVPLTTGTYTDSRTTALKMPASQFFYCLATKSNTTLPSNVTTGASGANGDLYCTGSLQLNSNDIVNGDVESTATSTQGGATVTGLVSSDTIPIPLPVPTPRPTWPRRRAISRTFTQESTFQVNSSQYRTASFTAMETQRLTVLLRVKASFLSMET